MFNRILLKIIQKEWLLYLVASALAFLIGVVIFSTLNNRFDQRLNDQLTEGELSDELMVLSFKYYALGHSEYWSRDSIDKNNEHFMETWRSLEENARPTKAQAILQNLLLYNDTSIASFSEAKKGFWTPYMGNPDVSLNDVLGALDWSSLPVYFGDDGVDNVKRFFSEDLSPVLDNLKANNAYVYRRYLNGTIQFITVWIALIGILVLIVSGITLFMEKKSLKQAISSFGLPQNMDDYHIGQFEGTLSRLRELQAHSHSDLRELIINAGTTFSWRGKEEAEATLNLEIQELRENMDSRFGLIKYFAWAVPSIGFIGTVIGIGHALGNAHNVIGQGAEYQTKGQIQIITGQLGVAFDTTLVSLLLSIVLVLCLHVVSRREEHLLSTSVAAVKRELLSKVAPLERANKQRRFNLLLEFLKSHTSPAELQTEPFLSLKQHLEDELNINKPE